LLLVFNVWTLYNIPVVVVGIRHLIRAGRKKGEGLVFFDEDLPFVSIVVPVKNEEKVAARLLKSLLNLNYPSSKKEFK